MVLSPGLPLMVPVRMTNVILGLGETGLSYARYLATRGEEFVVLDDRVSADRLAALRKFSPDAEVATITGQQLASARKVYVSPGVPLSLPSIVDNTKPEQLLGDIQLFGQLVKAPFVAITGTNGKSTVAQLVYEIAARQLATVALGGNIGKPCLDLLSPDVDLYVLEVSSYQLELAAQLAADVAVVLNLSADHLDRYPSEQDYFDTKLSLYDHCRAAVINRAVRCSIDESVPTVSIGMSPSDEADQFGVSGDTITLSGEPLVRKQDLRLSGSHNLLNVQAALAIGQLLNLDMASMLEVAMTFPGLPHRSEFVDEVSGVRYVNDSKGTNPGAMIAAVTGEAGSKNLHLIAGGVAKNADFSMLQPVIARYIKQSYLIGEAAADLKAALPDVPGGIYPDLAAAVEAARDNASPGDVVLLSPGCASFDQFVNYSARGEEFRRVVKGFAA